MFCLRIAKYFQTLRQSMQGMSAMRPWDLSDVNTAGSCRVFLAQFRLYQHHTTNYVIVGEVLDSDVTTVLTIRSQSTIKS